MNKYIFSVIKFYNYFLFFIVSSLPGAMPACDISDSMVRQVTSQAFTIWSLLDLAAHEQILDKKLFYHELCQSTLKLCKEVQQFKERGYQPADEQVGSLGELVKHLIDVLRALPATSRYDLRYTSAIDIILQYADYFLKSDLSIYADSEPAHSGF